MSSDDGDSEFQLQDHQSDSSDDQSLLHDNDDDLLSKLMNPVGLSVFSTSKL